MPVMHGICLLVVTRLVHDGGQENIIDCEWAFANVVPICLEGGPTSRTRRTALKSRCVYIPLAGLLVPCGGVRADTFCQILPGLLRLVRDGRDTSTRTTNYLMAASLIVHFGWMSQCTFASAH